MTISHVLAHRQFTVEDDVQVTDGVDRFDDDEADVEAYVETSGVFSTGTIRPMAHPDTQL